MIAMISPLIADAGPVIPKNGHASSCITQNRQFCASWFFDNFSSRFQPRLIEHIELTAIAVGIGMVIAFTAAIIAYKMGWFEGPFSLFSALPETIEAAREQSGREDRRDPDGVRGRGHPVEPASQPRDLTSRRQVVEKATVCVAFSTSPGTAAVLESE